MYSETYSSKRFGFLAVLVAITGAFCLMSLPQWIGWTEYAGLYELLVLLAAAFAVLVILRRSCYEYTYIINDDIVSVKLKVGMKETVLCLFPVDGIIATTFDEKRSELSKKYGAVKIDRCNGELFGCSGTQIIYKTDEKSLPAALIFRPSAKFTEILQYKHIDKQEVS